MNVTLAVFAGGGIGAVLRHLFIMAETRMFGAAFSYATFAVNVIGCFLLGALVEYTAQRSGISAEWRTFMATGILGGFTTFSTFSGEVIKLVQSGQTVTAAVYALASVVFSIAAAFGGLLLVRGVLS